MVRTWSGRKVHPLYGMYTTLLYLLRNLNSFLSLPPYIYCLLPQLFRRNTHRLKKLSFFTNKCHLKFLFKPNKYAHSPASLRKSPTCEASYTFSRAYSVFSTRWTWFHYYAHGHQKIQQSFERSAAHAYNTLLVRSLHYHCYWARKMGHLFGWLQLSTFNS